MPNQLWDLYGYAPWARRQNDLDSTITEAGDLGSPADTLSQMDVYWPVDLLPGDCPQARILTWGYDTTVTEGYKPVNGSDFFAHARNLLYALQRNRYDDPARDLIFVSHSLGGILVKETLRRSHQDEDKLVKAVFENTSGVFFFGTPHRGSREWASAAEAVSRTASLLLGVDTNSSLLHALLPNSAELQLCQEFFTTQWARRIDKLTVRTYQEGKPMTGLNFRGLNRKIVPDESSNLDNLGQQAQVINADHRNICKFNSKADEGYEMVSGDLRILVGKAISKKQQEQAEARKKLQEDEKACLQSLSFPELYARRERIESGLQDTCGWLFQHDSYNEWCNREMYDANHGLLWIKGKPGAGKSTLLKEAFLRKKKESSRKVVVAGFFFNARGDPLEKTAVGFYRGLLHELLQQHRPYMKELLTKFRDRNDTRGKAWKWTAQELQQFLLSLLTTSQSTTFFIFVDALDECEEETRRQVVDFIREASQDAFSAKATLNICFSSRHYPDLGSLGSPTIAVEAGNGADIISYIRQKLHAPDTDDSDSVLEDAIIAKAQGIFLWVVLVVEKLVQDLEDGKTLGDMLETLSEVPPRLEDLFKSAIDTLTQRERSTATLIIQWVLLAARPLSVEELRHALGFSVGGPYRTVKVWENSDRHVKDDNQMLKLIRSHSRGLVEAKFSNGNASNRPYWSRRSAFHQTVYFIHESVRQFFLQGEGFHLLDSGRNSMSLGEKHCFLSEVCLNYTVAVDQELQDDGIQPGFSDDINEMICKARPFVGYAQEYIFHHARQAEAQRVVPKFLIWSFAARPDRLYDEYPFLPSVQGQTVRLETSLTSLSSFHKLDSSLLCWLCKERLPLSVEFLLCQGADPMVQDAISQYPLFVAVLCLKWNKNLESPDAVALAKSIRLLIEHGADVEIKDDEGLTILHHAATLQDKALMALLMSCLKSKECIIRTDTLGNIPLHIAARDGHVEVMQCLIAEGSSLLREQMLAREKDGNIPLHLAVEDSSESAIRLFLSQNKYLVHEMLLSQNNDGNTPLHLVRLRPELSRLLLKHGADPMMTNKLGVAALTASGINVVTSANAGYMDLLEHCVGLSMDVDEVASPIVLGAQIKDATALHVAAATINTAMIERLLELGASVSRTTSRGLTALHCAVYVEVEYRSWRRFWTAPQLSSDLEVASLLLDHGAVIDAEDECGCTPLSHAVHISHTEMIQALLQRGARTMNSTWSSSSPLLVAIELGDRTAVKLLMEATSITASNRDHDSILHAVVRFKPPLYVVEYLIAFGADVDAVNIRGESALDVARSLELRGGIVELLDSWSEKPLPPQHIRPQCQSLKAITVTDVNLCRSVSTVALKSPPVIFRTSSRPSIVYISQRTTSGSKQFWSLRRRLRSPRQPLLYAAADRGDYRAVKLLVNRGKEVCAPENSTSFSWTPLHVASYRGFQRIAHYLIRAGADIAAVDKRGNTPLHIAVREGQVHIVNILRRNGADINALNKRGNSPLDIAIIWGRVTVQKLLLKAGASLRAGVDVGHTPLHTAIASGAVESIQLLIAAGVDPDEVDDFGRTPRQYARVLFEQYNRWIDDISCPCQVARSKRIGSVTQLLETLYSKRSEREYLDRLFSIQYLFSKSL